MQLVWTFDNLRCFDMQFTLTIHFMRYHTELRWDRWCLDDRVWYFWYRYARFEEKHNYIQSARRIYERAVEFFGEENMEETLIIAFAKFEENQREVRPHITIKLYTCTVISLSNVLDELIFHNLEKWKVLSSRHVGINCLWSYCITYLQAACYYWVQKSLPRIHPCTRVYDQSVLG